VISCPACGTQNDEITGVCRRCGNAIAASPTMSISSKAEVGTPRATPSSHPSSPALGFAPGALIDDRYRVTGLLGRGGMGEVYGADDLKLGQRVALKFLPADRLKSTSWREQFYAEVRMARQVSHPNVCRVYDVGESDGRLFLSMEFVDGEDLASLLRRIGRLPEDKAAEVAQQLCSGLSAAHASGVLHRDLKPSNVMLDGKGRARITDFGLAIAATDADRQQGPAGTPGYLAPELFNGAKPSVQSDLYALGLIFYELFTGKKAFEAPSVAELYRKQTETNPTPPSSVVKNLDPVVERVILRCLDRDPTQRPRSAQTVAAALPGGDPLAAALAAGETPSPDIVAAAGPQGSLRPAYAWACLIAAIALLLVTATIILPRTSDWGRTPMPKSPEVLADRAQELAQKLGYSGAVDRAYWIGSDENFVEYLTHDATGKKLAHAFDGQVWPSPTAFWFRQSPQWMMPGDTYDTHSAITPVNPPYETSGMATLKLDMQGRLLFLRGLPSQVDVAQTGREPDWNLLFAEAGLDQSQFVPGAQKWAPPDRFDASADWDGYVAGHRDVPLHVTAAAWRGRPVYFQVIAPWDKPWQLSPPDQLMPSKAVAVVVVSLLLAYAIVAGFFARRNFRSGRADVQGALRLGVFVTLSACATYVLNCRFVPVPAYIWFRFCMVAGPLLTSWLAWIGYMAVEPYARRMWPKAMVSWQRLLNGRLRDPLIGRDIVLGTLAGSATSLVENCVRVYEVAPKFGRGVLAATSDISSALLVGCLMAFLYLATLSALTGLFRRRWLGLLMTGMIIVVGALGSGIGLFLAGVLVVVSILTILTRVGLLALAAFLFTDWIDWPPLNFSQWYAGVALIPLVARFALLIYAFYISLGSQPVFGNVLKED
jgi:predicted Ser/Thr protein kinase